jgi:pyrophosphatase PpaX
MLVQRAFGGVDYPRLRSRVCDDGQGQRDNFRGFTVPGGYYGLQPAKHARIQAILEFGADETMRERNHKGPKYRAVLFDFDGTLTPSLPLWVKGYRIALRGGFGLVLSDDDIIKRCFFRDWGEVAADLDIASVEELRVQVQLGVHEAFLEAQLFPLARPLLEHCRAHGLQTALVTSSPRAIVGPVAARLGLHELLDFVISGDDVKNYKPHPEPVLATLAALGRAADDAIMVGDSRADILAGKAAGVATALFLPEEHNRFHSFDELRATRPDHVFVDHTELPELLGLPELAEDVVARHAV